MSYLDRDEELSYRMAGVEEALYGAGRVIETTLRADPTDHVFSVMQRGPSETWGNYLARLSKLYDAPEGAQFRRDLLALTEAQEEHALTLLGLSAMEAFAHMGLEANP